MNSIIQRVKDYKCNKIYIKRDDLLPFSFGGNKVRKAFLFFDDLKNKGCDCVVTYGSGSSNHCRVIANMAILNRIPCYIVSPIEDRQTTANSKLIDIFGAMVINCTVKDVHETIDKVLNDLRMNQNKNPYFIEGGGHGNIGTQAYVNCFNEIIQYQLEHLVQFDYIFLVSGTGSTQAGLICGALLNNSNVKIIGISNARQNPYGKTVIEKSVCDYLKSINYINYKKININFIDDYILEGYESYNKEIVETISDVLKYDGIPMDTTYVGKGYWGMRKYITENTIKNKNILFVHTGGTPLFFDKIGEYK